MGLDTVVVIGGPTSGNPFGHVGIAFTGKGVYSYGTNTPIGGSLTDYLSKQARYRSSIAYILKTTPEQEEKMHAEIMKYIGVALPNPREDPLGAANDTCAVRTQSALEAGGITSIYLPIKSLFPGDTAFLAWRHAATKVMILKGGAVPSELSTFNP
jgi:hypothetical protein